MVFVKKKTANYFLNKNAYYFEDLNYYLYILLIIIINIIRPKNEIEVTSYTSI